MKKTIFLWALLFAGMVGSSQTKVKINGWHLLDPSASGYMGISLDKAYELLKGRKSETVIVAVIDSGIDTAQEDLRPVLWTNEKEIPGNGLDDDGNGYADDVHGWNFDGAKNGENLARNSHEISRVYHNWRAEFEGKKEKDIPQERKYLYGQWVKAEALINKDYEEAVKVQTGTKNFQEALEKASRIINTELSITEFTAEKIKPLLTNRNGFILHSAEMWTDVFSRNPGFQKSTDVLASLTAYINDINNKINRKLVPPEDWRGELVKDNYLDINDRFYGNNNLKAGSGDHGTTVAGIIGAARHNGIGVDGIADNVRIMAVRAVPGGDEHDKDVALAIRYAVDNGAKVINMSFGKPVSPYKNLVDDAVRYAASKGVLLVHASGNDGANITANVFYPNPVFLDGRKATNFLTVGASGDPSTGGYAASFSNYSHDFVDVFAPGMNIYSTATDNRYNSADGTSVASPVATGIAALLKSYFSQLTPEQIIHILTSSGTPVNEDVQLPGSQSLKVRFSNLSSSGKIVNAYGAVKMAIDMEK